MYHAKSALIDRAYLITLCLQLGSLACRDWDILAPDSVNLNEHASIITDYITFCMDSTIPMKTVTVYPNSKPWITSDVIKKNTLKKKTNRIPL